MREGWWRERQALLKKKLLALATKGIQICSYLNFNNNKRKQLFY